MKKLLFILFFTVRCFAQSIGEDNNQFAFALFEKLPLQEKNLVFSPYSLFSNLTLLYFGARDTTADQIKSALHLSSTDERFLNAFQKHLSGLTRPTNKGYQLSVANGLFAHKGTHFLKSYEELATKTFEAKLQSIDFDVPDSALETINQWISEKTKGKIPQLVDPSDINSATRLILANAVYFQGEWVHPFSPKKIKRSNFHSNKNQSIEVDMLTQTEHFPYFEDQNMQCLALPFARKDVEQPFLECVIVLPKNTITEIENLISFKKLDEWLYSTQSTLAYVEIPKFCLSQRLKLNAPLKELGIRDAFSFQANFSRIDNMRDLFLNQVLHETYFSFHENGVTAASASTSHIGIKSPPPSKKPVVSFIADRPFLFFLVDYHSRAILFMGRMSNPSMDTCNVH